MRYLTIARHAKALAASPGQSDFDRALAERGQRQCERLRTWASDPEELGGFGPTTSLVSAAVRTRETFQRSFAGTSFEGATEFSTNIYNGQRDVHPEDLLAALSEIDPLSTSLLIVGHNPTLYELMCCISSELPPALRDGRFPLGSAFVLAIENDRPVATGRYEVVAAYDPN